MRRLLTPGWLAIHVLLVASVVGMLGLAGWQWSRAAGGNSLSWGYAFQWPVFAGFAVAIWVREARRVVRGAPEPVLPPVTDASLAPPAVEPRGPDHVAVGAAVGAPVITRRPAAYDGGDDPEVAEYNRFLAWMSANPGARAVDYPG
ncbi:hypothetical protein JQS43_19305 [Natronosporangium hydrolyticum]|uniref:DNA-binding transcriptional regulator of glucitol operon n=1 Tax=Natronosporangium hydrolyticum TaxID=2811111 RepID=A0A895Y8N5_9ACTN|nr:hypothetical protein [Natronosporangium hydrolyticum]QSB13701.1 hypothetical protein JQS43_19305 [Natronosporangium hydrolyticum]